jgi:hypothetical protein
LAIVGYVEGVVLVCLNSDAEKYHVYREHYSFAFGKKTRVARSLLAMKVPNVNKSFINLTKTN